MAKPLKTKDDLKKEAKEAFYKEFGITKTAAEKSAATKEKDLPGYDPKKEDEDVVLYSEEDREKENEYSTFGSDFLEELEKDEPKYLSPADKRKQKTSDSIFNAYNTGEEWLMSDGDGDLAKGFINNFRSAIGTGLEDLAYLITDYAPWYKPAQNVVEKNTAGKIEEQAQKQFGNAKANGVNGRFVDAMDAASKSLGYSLFGFKAGDYVEGLSEGFDEYRNLREQGYSKEEATRISSSKIPLAILSTKADDYIGKNSKVDDALFSKSGIVDKVDNKPPIFEIKSAEDSKKVLEYLEYIKKDSTIKYESEDVRKWYVSTTSQIHKMVDDTLSMEEKAHKAFDLRNKIRTGARDIMKDVEKRKRLDIEHSNFTFDELLESKMKRKGLTREEAIQDIYETAPKTNKEVNAIWGILNE